MLSRFSKLPGVSSILHSNVEYSQETIDAVVSEIKALGKAANTNDQTLRVITKILTLMKRYSESLAVQRVSCHALSNMAMQVAIARWIVQKGGFSLVKKALQKFETDHKLAWLASSAIWNLARPPNNRTIIGQQGVTLMIRMLKLHGSREKVVNTSIGALSNLSLNDSMKSVIASEENMELIISILLKYVHKQQSLTVATSGAGLVANLAVSDEFASMLVKKKAIDLLLQLLTWKGSKVDDTLHRNTCAALNNMVTATDFLNSVLESRGVETIFAFLETNTNQVYTNLLENCLVNIEVDSHQKISSQHLCAVHGKKDILIKLLTDNPFTDLDELDAKQMSMLDYAIMGKHVQVVEFLSRCGARKYKTSLLTEQNNDHEHLQEISKALENGEHVLHKTKRVHVETVTSSLPDFPAELCNLLVTFNGTVDMLQAINMFE